MALVVYGVMRARECPERLRVQTRRRTVVVRGVKCDDICALVGSAPDGPVRVRRDAVLAHSEVLHSVMERGPVLPLRFGVVMEDEDSVKRELLAPEAGALSARLDALEGSAEFQLKGVFDSERVLAAILGEDRQLADSAALVRALPGAAGHFDRIRLGERIAQRIEQRGEIVEAEVIHALEPFAVAVTPGRRQHEWMALNVAFLVFEEQRSEFDDAVDRLNLGYAGEVHFKLIGPLPPHTFAEHEWEAGARWG